MVDELGGAAVSGDRAGHHHVVGKLRREEPCRCGVVGRSITGHVEERGGGRPSCCGHHQVAVDPIAVGELGPADSFLAPSDPRDGLPPAGVGSMADQHPGPFQIGHGGIAGLIGGHDHGPGAWFDRPQVDEPSHPGGEHHPRKVVALEYKGAFDQARGHHQGLGSGLDQPLMDAGKPSLDDCDPVLVVPARHH